MTHREYLRQQKALAHTETLRLGAGIEQLAVFMIACAKVAQADGDYPTAECCLECAADLYSQPME